MQAKLDEEAGQLVQLRQNIEQEWAGRALVGEARHRAGMSSAVSLTMPGQGCPRPPAGSARIWLQRQYYSEQYRSHPPPRARIQGELKNLLEDAAVRRAESSASQRQGCPRSIAQRLPGSCGRPRSTPGARRTRRLQPRITSATSTTAATVEPASTRRCAKATTPGVGTLRQ
jgi:hypothetical protein